MSYELVATKESMVNFDNQSGPPDIAYLGDVAIKDNGVTETLATTCEAEGSPIAVQSLSFSWNILTFPCPHSSATYDFVSGAGALVATATKVFAENKIVLRENDGAATPTCAGTWKLKVSPFTVVACTCKVKISDAKQTTVSAQ